MDKSADKLINLGAEVIFAAPPESTKPLLIMIGSVLLAEKFERPEWLETIKEQE